MEELRDALIARLAADTGASPDWVKPLVESICMLDDQILVREREARVDRYRENLGQTMPPGVNRPDPPMKTATHVGLPKPPRSTAKKTKSKSKKHGRQS